MFGYVKFCREASQNCPSPYIIWRFALRGPTLWPEQQCQQASAKMGVSKVNGPKPHCFHQNRSFHFRWCCHIRLVATCMTHPYGSVNFYIHEVLAVSRRVGTCVSWTLEKLGAVFWGYLLGMRNTSGFTGYVCGQLLTMSNSYSVYIYTYIIILYVSFIYISYIVHMISYRIIYLEKNKSIMIIQQFTQSKG